jgi:hypothetical protein
MPGKRNITWLGDFSGAELAITCVMMGKSKRGLQLPEEGYDQHLSSCPVVCDQSRLSHLAR